MKCGRIVFLERYIDSSYGGETDSMTVAIMRTTWLGRKKIDKRNIYGFSNDTLKVGDEVYYHFDEFFSSKCYVIKKEEA